jgi:hypothetical protein
MIQIKIQDLTHLEKQTTLINIVIEEYALSAKVCTLKGHPIFCICIFMEDDFLELFITSLKLEFLVTTITLISMNTSSQSNLFCGLREALWRNFGVFYS